MRTILLGLLVVAMAGCSGTPSTVPSGGPSSTHGGLVAVPGPGAQAPAQEPQPNAPPDPFHASGNAVVTTYRGANVSGSFNTDCLRFTATGTVLHATTRFNWTPQSTLAGEMEATLVNGSNGAEVARGHGLPGFAVEFAGVTGELAVSLSAFDGPNPIGMSVNQDVHVDIDGSVTAGGGLANRGSGSC